ncbi:MAG: MipA/OmpV family protein [Steroidobacteraceae bacterium]
MSPIQSARSKVLRLTAVMLLATTPLGVVRAQGIEQQALEQQGLTEQVAPETWSVTLGGGLADAPRYPGASTNRVRFVPLASAVYDDRVSLGPLGLGVAVLRWNGFRAGPVLGFQGGRQESDDPRLAGLGDISSSVTAGAFAGYGFGPLSVSTTVRQAISHSTNGLSGLVQINFHHRVAGTRTFLMLGPDFEFGNGNFERTWFGITPQQSAMSPYGLSVYTPRAGIDRVGLHAALTHVVSAHFLVHAFASFKELTGDAAASPIVERRDQFVIGAGIAYHF